MSARVRAATIGFVLMGSAGVAQATTYTVQGGFQGQLGTMLTDTYAQGTYGYATGSYTVLSDSAMSAKFGQTKYTTLTYSNMDIVGMLPGAQNASYCSGCNGDFRLDFTATSVGTAQGVYGFGFNYVSNDGLNSSGIVTYGDGSTESVTLTAPSGSSPAFFGDTSASDIKSFTTTSANLIISMLTIGNQSSGGGGGTAVPEPGSAVLLGTAVVALGVLARRRRRAR